MKPSSSAWVRSLLKIWPLSSTTTLLVPAPQPFDDLALLLHLVLAAEDAEVLVHRLGELVADRPRPLAVLALEELLQLALGVRLHEDGTSTVVCESAQSAAWAPARLP